MSDNSVQIKIAKAKEDLEQRLAMQINEYNLNKRTGKIEITTKEMTLWKGIKSKADKVIDDIGKAHLRHHALQVLADEALEEVYAEIEAKKQARKEAKLTAKEPKIKVTKLEAVVAAATN
jgi:hypothetical protein